MTIKISQLGNLTSFTGNTIFPVVDTANAYITVKSTGAVLLNYISGNLTTLTVRGNITGGNLTTTGTLNVTGNILGAVITGSGLNVSGNVSANTVSAYALSGIITTASQTNITAIGTLGNLNVTGNLATTNISASGYYFADGNAITYGGNLRISNVYIPAANNSIGTAGQVSFDSSYFYVCINTNTWRRANLVSW
jgi:cytoskeletal protein CcmA (bactofilin family)